MYLANLRGGVPPERIVEIAERLLLELSRKMREYSKGNKQKVRLAQAFKWPEAVQHLSIVHYYGRPTIDGVVWTDMGVLMAAALAFAAVSLAGFRRRDIAR